MLDFMNLATTSGPDASGLLDVVNLTATFKTLASGLNHVDFGEVTVPAK